MSCDLNKGCLDCYTFYCGEEGCKSVTSTINRNNNISNNNTDITGNNNDNDNNKTKHFKTIKVEECMRCNRSATKCSSCPMTTCNECGLFNCKRCFQITRKCVSCKGYYCDTCVHSCNAEFTQTNLLM